MRRVCKNRVVRLGETVIEILKSFEQEAGRFSPMVLLVPGLAMVALGLIAWLAGMCLRRLVLAGAGAVAGGLAGWLIHGQNPAVVGLAAGGGAVFVAILPRLFTAVLLAALGVAVAFAVTAGTHLVEGQKTSSGRQDLGRGQERLTVQESLGAVRVFAFDIVGRTESAARELEPANLVLLAAVGLVLLVLGLLLARLAGALVFSAMGTALIFAGLIVLLIFKGSAPIAFVQKQGAFYGLVLFGMAAFGTLEQLVLCPSPKRGRKAKSAGSRPRQGESEHGWRNH
jgi:hypothetical protein